MEKKMENDLETGIIRFIEYIVMVFLGYMMCIRIFGVYDVHPQLLNSPTDERPCLSWSHMSYGL